MAEELSFDDIDTSADDDRRPAGIGQIASSRSHSSFEGTGIPMHASTRSTNGTRTPGSPGGSVDSVSLASRSSDALRSQQSSKRSMKSYERGVDRVPPAQDELNRMASI
jgi:hypothetical protein